VDKTASRALIPRKTGWSARVEDAKGEVRKACEIRVQLVLLDENKTKPAETIKTAGPVSRDELIERATGERMDPMRFRAKHATGALMGRQVKKEEMIHSGETVIVEVSGTDLRVIKTWVFASEDLTEDPKKRRKQSGKIYLRPTENMHDLAALVGISGFGPNDRGGLYIATTPMSLEHIPFESMMSTATDFQAPS
jgi:hypothetical protein